MTSVISPMGPTAARHPEAMARKAKAQAMYEGWSTYTAIGVALDRNGSLIRKWKQMGNWQRVGSNPKARFTRPAVPGRPLDVYEHPPMPRCSIVEPHTNCGYFADQDITERKAIQFGHVAREDRLEWRTKVLANRGMDIRSIARQLECTVAEVRRWMPPKGKVS